MNMKHITREDMKAYYKDILELRLNEKKNLSQCHALQEFTTSIRNDTNTKTTKQVM